MLADIISSRFASLRCSGRQWSLRVVDERSETLSVRRDVIQPPAMVSDRGAMVTVYKNGGAGYAATSDLTVTGLQRAVDEATRWAEVTARLSVVDFRTVSMPSHSGEYSSPSGRDNGSPWERSDWYELLRRESESAHFDPRVVDWEASVELREAEHVWLSSTGGRTVQKYKFVMPNVTVTANEGSRTQTRTLNGTRGICQQGGVEILERFGLVGSARRIAEEALELLAAENCPGGEMTVLLMPDQMMLQIHESIGHPLELDRILGDERNFAGTSFVTPEMFGTYQYGSKLLNVAFDPTRPEELASYGFDDDGTRAEKVYVIRDGVLQRPLGGALSQQRASLPGTANSRADSWNRPPIDRMANLNLEPGDKSLTALIASVEHGVLMETNNSWSIDDSRNKFQFGCERARRIENGELKEVVRNPNYRGVSAVFWRSLAAVGDTSTMQTLGTPWCGKGEPSQIIRVGHASPACVFTGVEVFGGEG